MAPAKALLRRKETLWQRESGKEALLIIDVWEVADRKR